MAAFGHGTTARRHNFEPVFWPNNDFYSAEKATTVAGWSNLPGKALLFDQLARLKRNSDRVGPIRQRDSNLKLIGYT